MDARLDEKSPHRSGYVALVGRPNVGKSTLLNALLGQKLAIVSPKPQTTRHRVMGVVSDAGHQMIFLDTPGLLTPRYRLQRAMLAAARRALMEADVILVLHDVTTPMAHLVESMTEARRGRGRLMVALNKVDRIARHDVLPMIDAVTTDAPDLEVVPISALEGENLDRLLSVVGDALPPGPPLYPEDTLTEHPERFFVSEIIRENVLAQFRDEVPYAVQVEIDAFTEGDGTRRDEIHATVCVERPSQKRILVGAHGSAVKELGIQSRRAIEEFLDRPVVLKLFVKVVPDWRQDPRRLREMGYDA